MTGAGTLAAGTRARLPAELGAVAVAFGSGTGSATELRSERRPGHDPGVATLLLRHVGFLPVAQHLLITDGLRRTHLPFEAVGAVSVAPTGHHDLRADGRVGDAVSEQRPGAVVAGDPAGPLHDNGDVLAVAGAAGQSLRPLRGAPRVFVGGEDLIRLDRLVGGEWARREPMHGRQLRRTVVAGVVVAHRRSPF